MHSKNRVEHESLKQQFWHNLLMTRPAKKQLKISRSITSKTEENGALDFALSLFPQACS